MIFQKYFFTFVNNYNPYSPPFIPYQTICFPFISTFTLNILSVLSQLKLHCHNNLCFQLQINLVFCSDLSSPLFFSLFQQPMLILFFFLFSVLILSLHSMGCSSCPHFLFSLNQNIIDKCVCVQRVVLLVHIVFLL